MPSDGSLYDPYTRSITYSSGVTRDSVCIALTTAALHDLVVKAANVLNTYVMAPNREKIWMVLGSEFTDNAGTYVIIVRALYSLQSEGPLFRAHLAKCVQELRHESHDADPDLWMKAEFRLEDKLEYYTYILCYVDDTFCIHHDPDHILNKLNRYLKPGPIWSFDMY